MTPPPIEIAALDRGGQGGEVGTLIGEIGGLALNAVRGFAQQTVDHHNGLAGFVFQQAQLAMVFIDRAGNIVGGADLIQRVMRGGAVVGDVGAQRIEGIHIGRQSVELALGGIPLRHQFGIAAGGADLQAGGDMGLGVLIGASGAGARIAQLSQARGIGGQSLLQARNLGAQGLNGLVDGGSGIDAVFDIDRGDGGDRSAAGSGGQGRGRAKIGGGRRPAGGRAEIRRPYRPVRRRTYCRYRSRRSG